MYNVQRHKRTLAPVLGDKNTVMDATGDTIKNWVKLENFIFDENGLKSYLLKREIGIITDIKKDIYGYDSLVVKKTTINEVVNYK